MAAPASESSKSNICKSLSIVIPAYNEQESIEPLYRKITETLNTLNIPTEIIFVNDGSTDGTQSEIERLPSAPYPIIPLEMRRNFGKSIALSAGFEKCTGEIVITMDADLQDDPAEIPSLISKINEGWDLVSGWKAKRKDPNEKLFASKIFNGVVSRISGLKLHDFNCGLKAYRLEVVKKIRIYGGRHRFIPIIAHSYGYRVCEIAVKHHERQFGISKYGMRRYLSGLFDFFTIFFLMYYQRRPLHFLGKISFFPMFAGVALVIYVLIMKYGYGETGDRPALLAGIFLMSSAFQIFFFGLLAELITHIRIADTFNPDDFVTNKSQIEPAGTDKSALPSQNKNRLP